MIVGGCGSKAAAVSETAENVIAGAAEADAPSESESAAVEKVNEYNVNLDINPKSHIARGVLRVDFVNTTGMSLDCVYFNVYLNAFRSDAETKPYFESLADKIFPDGVVDYGYTIVTGAVSRDEKLTYEMDGEILTVKFNNPLEAGEEIEISISFESYIPTINDRTGANDSAMWFGNFLPVLAAYDGTRWRTDPYYPVGEPFYSGFSNYTVTITAPPDYIVVATGGDEETSEANGSRTTVITAKMTRDFAFALSNKYVVTTKRTPSNKYINLYTYSDIKNKDRILEIASQSLEYFSSLLGNYPAASFNIVETGLYTPAVQYPNIAFIDSQYLRDNFNGDNPDEAPSAVISSVIGRQWFYGVTGSDNINEPWIDEGLTSFLQYDLFFTKSEIIGKMQNEYDNLNAEIKTMDVSELSMRNGLADYGSWKDFTLIQNVKPTLMLYGLEIKLGDEKFNEFIKTYFSKYKYKIATSQDFIATAEAVYGGSLAGFFDSWFDAKPLPPLS